MKTSHPESPKAAYYSEKTNLQFHKNYVFGEDQHANPFQKPWICQVLQTPQVAPDVLKAPAILSDTTIRRSAVDREDLKPYWK